MENNNNTRFLREKLFNIGEKSRVVKDKYTVKYCYNHTEFNHSPKLSKLQRNTNSKYQVSPTTLKSQARPSEYKIEIKLCIFFLSPTLSFFFSPVHSLPLLLGSWLWHPNLAYLQAIQIAKTMCLFFCFSSKTVCFSSLFG